MWHYVSLTMVARFLRCIAQTDLGNALWRGLIHPHAQAAHRGELLHQAAGRPYLQNLVSSSIPDQVGYSLATAAVVHLAPRELIQRQANQGPLPFHGQRLQEVPVMTPSTVAWSFCPLVVVKGNKRNGEESKSCLRLCK
jgi:hypothetical protein